MIPYHMINLLHLFPELGYQDVSLQWFCDYLTGRNQRVVLDGVASNVASVTSGVPQGSILGPLLFNISMRSIANLQLSLNARMILYANDILLYKPVDTEADALDLQQDVDSA